VQEVKLETGTLRLISATDCVKDRLCAYYFWDDLQGLEQAILVFQQNNVPLAEIERWSIAEAKQAQFALFKKRVD
jgi:hypothetical protein